MPSYPGRQLSVSVLGRRTVDRILSDRDAEVVWAMGLEPLGPCPCLTIRIVSSLCGQQPQVRPCSCPHKRKGRWALDFVCQGSATAEAEDMKSSSPTSTPFSDGLEHEVAEITIPESLFLPKLGLKISIPTTTTKSDDGRAYTVR